MLRKFSFVISFIIIFPIHQSAAQVQSHLSKNIFSLNYALISLSKDTTLTNFAFIDSLYRHTLNLTKNDISEALLLLTLVTLPYDTVPVKLFSNFSIGYPLPGVDKELFRSKVNSLPSALFSDSPPNSFGDKDKIAHFFASAFFSFNGSKQAALYLGMLVEIFEQLFVPNGTIDRRDLAINYAGVLFGAALSEKQTALPSLFFPQSLLPPELNVNYEIK